MLLVIISRQWKHGQFLFPFSDFSILSKLECLYLNVLTVFSSHKKKKKRMYIYWMDVWRASPFSYFPLLVLSSSISSGPNCSKSAPPPPHIYAQLQSICYSSLSTISPCNYFFQNLRCPTVLFGNPSRLRRTGAPSLPTYTCFSIHLLQVFQSALIVFVLLLSRKSTGQGFGKLTVSQYTQCTGFMVWSTQ